MQAVLDILKSAGGWHPGLYLKIDHAPHMELVIEAMDESGPCGLPALCVCHYGEQNRDLVRDPEMCFELGLAGGAYLTPFYWRSDYVGVEQWSRFIRDSDYCLYRELSCSTSTSPRYGTATCIPKASPRYSTRRSTDAANPFPSPGAGTQPDLCRSATTTLRSPTGEPTCKAAANSSTSPSTPSTKQPPPPAAPSMSASWANWLRVR